MYLFAEMVLMKNVRLCINEIGDEGSKAIAYALAKNRTVTILGLAENKITAKGAEAIATALADNTAIIGIA